MTTRSLDSSDTALRQIATGRWMTRIGFAAAAQLAYAIRPRCIAREERYKVLQSKMFYLPIGCGTRESPCMRAS